MNETLLADRRIRAVLVLLFAFAASAAAGWAIYTRTGKVLAIVAFITVGIFLRQATFPNGFMVMVLAAQLSLVRFTVIKEEFEIDKWLALAGMAAVSVAVVAFQAHDPPWPGLAHVLAAGLLAVAAFSTWWSVEPSVSFAKAGAFGLGLTVVFLGVWGWARRPEDIRVLVDRLLDTLWLVFPACFLVLLVPIGGSYMAGRFQGFYTNPNQLGFWGSVGLPLLLAQSMQHPTRWRRRAYALMFVTGWAVVLASGSRGGILGAGIGCTGYLLARFPRRTGAALALVGVVYLFLLGYGVDLSAIAESEIVRADTLYDLSDRRVWWEIGMMIAAQQKWLGHGFGTGEGLFEHYLMDLSVDTYGPTIHNSYLDSYMTIGLVGTGLLLLLQCWCGWVGLRTWWRDRTGEVGLLALALLCSAVAISAHAFVETVLLLVGNPWTIPFYMMLALLPRLAQIQRERARAVAAARRVAVLQPVAVA